VHRIIERRRLLKCDVSAEGLVEASVEQLDLLNLADVWITAREGHETLGEVVNCPVVADPRQLADEVVCQRRPATRVDELREVILLAAPL
jgi:hypothetical protein